ncbi:MAG: branched-chain amino acid transport system II carrier protein [Erysipelotrichaceae bacterium]|nr:branched-chain amino acid transport system II carrier protein [Erysipelotrichaceae bacterium]
MISVSLGLTLFSMLFGAGNLIFAPLLGCQAALSTPAAIAGFCITAVVLPIASILIISCYPSASKMVSTINPVFAKVFITLVFLLVGPCIAIPRTASTSFEMFEWLFHGDFAARVLYSTLFFTACFFTALNPGKLKDILGKVMGPILLAMVLILCTAVLLYPAQWSQAAASASYSSPFLKGLNEGYQTMDILAGFCFSVIMAVTFKSFGLENGQESKSILFRAGIIAGCLLALLYTLLAGCAMKFAGQIPDASNGARILLWMSRLCFSDFGAVFISLIFLAACFNVCSGLLACCSQYFCTLIPKVSYKTWLIIFTLSGLVVSVQGLDWILAISAPLLSVVGPIAVLLSLWGLLYPRFRKAS